jgi:cytochrome o ubiquinol oxidase subunit 2
MARILFALPLLLLVGCTSENSSFLDPQGPIAAAQRWHLFEVLALLMIVVLPVLVLTPVIAWRYRRQNEKSRYAPKWDFSRPLEVAIWGVPVAIVVVMAVLLWRSTAALDPYQPLQADKPALRVQVVGLDWKWLFIYPDEHIASVGELAFPADRPLALELTTDSVMQSFFIPALGSQIYAMAGMVTKLHLQAYGPGRFHGENSQFNGKGFPRQKFTAVAMPADGFAAWVNTVRSEGISLDAATYGKLARKSTTETAREALDAAAMPPGVLYFNAVPPNLFVAIVNKYRYGQAQASRQTGPATDAAATGDAPILATRQEAGQ